MANPGNMNTEAFAALAADAVKQTRDLGDCVFFDRQRFQLLIKDSFGRAKHTIKLRKIFDRYKANSSDYRETVMSDLVQTLEHAAGSALPEDYQSAMPHLRIQLKDRCTYSSDSHYPYYVVGEHFAAFIAYDLPDDIVSVDMATLQTWGVSFEQAFQVAAKNLFERTQFDVETFDDTVRGGAGLHLFKTDDGYGAARAIFAGAFERLPVHGERLIVIPNSDCIIITGSESEEGLREVLKALYRAKHLPQPLAPVLMALRDSSYFPYRLSPTHSLYKGYLQLEIQYLNELYTNQKDELDSQNQEMPWISNYRLNRSNKGEPFSTCSVEANYVPALLPKTEYVLFNRGDYLLSCAPWDKVEDVLKNKLELTKHYPARFLLRHFPNVEELQMLWFHPLPD